MIFDFAGKKIGVDVIVSETALGRIPGTPKCV